VVVAIFVVVSRRNIILLCLRVRISNSTCYQNARVIDIGITFLASNNIKKTIFLTARINSATTVDLIIGRESLHLHNFFDLTPEHLDIPRRKEGDILDALQHNKACTCPPVESPPTTLPRQTQPEAHIGRSSCTPNFCSRDQRWVQTSQHALCARFSIAPAVARPRQPGVVTTSIGTVSTSIAPPRPQRVERSLRCLTLRPKRSAVLFSPSTR
jgi:hypothetical protein